MKGLIDKILDRLEEERELSYADFSRYVEEVSPCLDDEYDDFFHRGLERASRLVKEVKEEYKGGWIPCSVRLPEESLNSVIGWDAYRNRCVFAQYIQGKFQNMGKDDSFDIKAWMPLPEPFKECD